MPLAKIAYLLAPVSDSTLFNIPPKVGISANHATPMSNARVDLTIENCFHVFKLAYTWNSKHME